MATIQGAAFNQVSMGIQFVQLVVSPALLSSFSSSCEKPTSHWCSFAMDLDSSTMKTMQAPVGVPSGTSALHSSTISPFATTSDCLTTQFTVEGKPCVK